MLQVSVFFQVLLNIFRLVVSCLWVVDGIGGMCDYQYFYQGVWLDLFGCGFFGFCQMEVCDLVCGCIQVRMLCQDFFFVGCLDNEEISFVGKFLVCQQNQWKFVVIIVGKFFFVYLVQFNEECFDQGVLVSVMWCKVVMDESYGNFIQVIEEIVVSLIGGILYSWVVECQYSNDGVFWLVGFVICEIESISGDSDSKLWV